jgi:glycosyltransferase involved in cell wall biosynthesis
MRRVRVLHIKDSRGLWGAERVILTLAQSLDPARFELVLLCLRGDAASDALIAAARAQGLEVEVVPVAGRLDWSAVRTVRRLVVRRGVDIVHAHDFKSSFYALAGTVGLGVQRVVTAHGTTRDSLRMRAYLFLDEKLVYRAYDRVVAVAHNEAAVLRQRGVPERKIEVISNSIVLPPVSGARPSAGTGAFGVVGRLYPDKGHRFFLDAFEAVARRHPGARARIVGGGPLAETLAGEVAARGLAGRVSLDGVVEDMPRVYAELGAVVIPSLREGMPYVLLEAFAHRVPVLATAVGDIPRLVEHGRTGLLAPPGDAAALEAGMLRLLEAPGEARTMAEAAHRLLVERHSAGRMAEATARLYSSLAVAHRASA